MLEILSLVLLTSMQDRLSLKSLRQLKVLLSQDVIGRKCRLKERGIKPPYPEDTPMAKVTYRGVEYDSEEYNKSVLSEAAKRQRHDLMYRGIHVRSKAIPCS